VFWTNLDSNGTSDRLVLGLTDGSLLIAARRGDPTPIGGTFGTMDAWPAVSGDNGTLNVSTPGAPGGALSAHIVFSRCPSPTPTPTSTPTPTPTATPTPTPTPAPLTLSARGYRVHGIHTVDLNWTGGASANIDVYRNGVVVATTANDGFYTDSTGNKGRATYTYKVCEAGTQNCSNEVTVRFGGPQ